MTEFDNALTHKNDELDTGVNSVDMRINELKEVNDKQNECLDYQVDINKATREYIEYLESETNYLHKYCTVLSALYIFQFIFLIIMFIWLWVA